MDFGKEFLKISVLDYQIRQKEVIPIDLIKFQKTLSHDLFEQSPIAFLQEDFLETKQGGEDFLCGGGNIPPQRLLQAIKEDKGPVRGRGWDIQ